MKDERIQLQIRADERRLWKEEAKRCGLTLSGFISFLVHDWMSKQVRGKQSGK
jgi:uncharacterized protein (DUF1778 family)